MNKDLKENVKEICDDLNLNLEIDHDDFIITLKGEGMKIPQIINQEELIKEDNLQRTIIDKLHEFDPETYWKKIYDEETDEYMRENGFDLAMEAITTKCRLLGLMIMNL